MKIGDVGFYNYRDVKCFVTIISKSLREPDLPSQEFVYFVDADGKIERAFQGLRYIIEII